MAGDRPISPAGFAALRAEYDDLLSQQRPALVETIAWAAGNGDRSENGDYIYGRKKLREIDRRLAHLARAMKSAQIIDPAQQSDHAHVRFGACVSLEDGEGQALVVTLVGDEEADAGRGRVGWGAPLARALRGAAVGDVRTVTLPGGERLWAVTAITYPTGT